MITLNISLILKTYNVNYVSNPTSTNSLSSNCNEKRKPKDYFKKLTVIARRRGIFPLAYSLQTVGINTSPFLNNSSTELKRFDQRMILNCFNNLTSKNIKRNINLDEP